MRRRKLNSLGTPSRRSIQGVNSPAAALSASASIMGGKFSGMPPLRAASSRQTRGERPEKLSISHFAASVPGAALSQIRRRSPESRAKKSGFSGGTGMR